MSSSHFQSIDRFDLNLLKFYFSFLLNLLPWTCFMFLSISSGIISAPSFLDSVSGLSPSIYLLQRCWQELSKGPVLSLLWFCQCISIMASGSAPKALQYLALTLSLHILPIPQGPLRAFGTACSSPYRAPFSLWALIRTAAPPWSILACFSFQLTPIHPSEHSLLLQLHLLWTTFPELCLIQLLFPCVEQPSHLLFVTDDYLSPLCSEQLKSSNVLFVSYCQNLVKGCHVVGA